MESGVRSQESEYYSRYHPINLIPLSPLPHTLIMLRVSSVNSFDFCKRHTREL